MSSLRVLFLLAFAVGCERAPPRRAVADVPPAPAPLLRLEGLAPWSNPWILAHTESYLDDPAARRAAMERSLTQPSNLYSEARLTHYGRGTRGWDTLPEWNPRVLPFDRARAEAFARGDRIEVSAPAFFDGSRPTDWQAWVALGRRVFHELPLRSEPYWADALRDRALAERLGVERAPDGSVPGLVLMRDLDGASRVGITCALCHAAPLVAGRAFVDGRARRALDYGLARVALARSLGRPLSDEAEARFSGWGRGRADVLEELSEVPIAIPDLYGLRALRWLTQGATLRHVSPLALAVRQETQYVQANHLRTRPPRVLVWALVAFLYALEPPPASAPSPDATTLARGRVLFEAHCRGCHDGPAWSGDPTSLARIETDPDLARGRARNALRRSCACATPPRPSTMVPCPTSPSPSTPIRSGCSGAAESCLRTKT